MNFWKTLVGKLWYTIILLVACVLMTLGVFLLPYIDINFSASESGDIKRMFVLVCIIGFSLTTFFALFLFTKITQPMQQLIKATDEIRKGNYGTRLSLVTSDEIGELANAFNHMAGELEDTIRNLNHEKERVASVLRSMTDAVVSFDGEGRMISTNPPGTKVMSLWKGIEWNENDERHADRESSFQHIDNVPPPLRPLFYAVVAEGQDQSAEIHVKQSVWSIQMAPLHMEQGSRGAVAVLRDVTEEAHLEKMRSDFIANISHEIRTPLSMIQGYSEALLDGMAASPKESEELIQVIHDESLRMGRLVKDLLDLARMEAGHTDINLKQVDLNQLLERVYRKFSVAAKEQGLVLEYIHQEDSLILEAADEDKLEQVFTNLLDNAFRHTPSGKRIQIIANSTHSNQMEVRIKDEGKGIPREDLPFIFERFYKADKARVRDVGRGTGLGLAIVKHIVDAHHGTIEVDSIPGVGTEFSLLLPVKA
ncbi:cell wall metabolism sensor histidine kinase WalK [Neobacillus mesonae]|nr:cell wall metabolism sensor histidine kinase WalK [Neobacillus mesonae]